MMRQHIDTQRLRLRPLDRKDAERITALIADWEVISKLSAPPCPYALKDALEFIGGREAQTASTGLRDYAIEQSGVLVGVAGVAASGHGPVLGYWLGREAWGRGVMTEAARAVVAAFFEDPARDRLVSGAFAGNNASLAVQKKLGFEVVGDGRKFCRPRGCEVAHIDTELSRARYSELGP